MDWYEFLKDFQTAIVGVIGFGGVIWSQSASARQSRAQHKREVDQKRSAVKAAVLAELRMFRNIFERQSKAEPPEKGDSASVPRIKRSVTAALLGDIGLLADDRIDIEKVLDAIVAIDEIDRILHLISTNVSETHFSIGEPNWTSFVVLVGGVNSSISPAIVELEGKSAVK